MLSALIIWLVYSLLLVPRFLDSISYSVLVCFLVFNLNTYV